MIQTNITETPGRVYTMGEPISRAGNLARERTSGSGRALPLAPRLNEAAAKIAAAAAQANARHAAGQALPGELMWLTENYRFVEMHVRQVGKLLAKIDRKALPLATNGPRLGYPRVYDLAVELTDETGGHVGVESAAVFVEEYQAVAPLTMAELWVVDTMLRLALLEDLSSAVEGPAARVPALIVSLNTVGAESWQDFVEDNSRTEQILREDPSGFYARMDFTSRDRYRHAVANFAKRSEQSEEEVARAAVTLSRDALKRLGTESRESHVGYHLIDKGAARLKAGLQYRTSWRTRIVDMVLEWPTTFYLFGIELITLVLAATLLAWLPDSLQYLGLILFLLATEPAIAFMNQLSVYLAPPRRLPKLDFSEGIPAKYHTMVVVPTLLLSEEFIGKLLNALEVRYLANRDPQLSFALLTDFADSPHPELAEDQRLVECCAEGIRLLNERYASEGREPFYLFHRQREWNETQSSWMGWERKRGKLIALNNYLRGDSDAFQIKVGDTANLPSVRYVITLDSDTELPRGTAQQLAGTLAHPLNRAVIDPETNTVREGYGILQPRVGISVDSAQRSRLASIYSGQTGFDIYTTAVSDVYQDLFGEGSYVGKGIYDLDVFQATLRQRFPHDILLSHDLIEGTHARAGLVSDITLIDDYPSHYTAWSKRKHRWVRGDWQIMRWLLPRVPDFSGRLTHNPLSVISLWKIVDNMRRSLIEIAIFVLLIAGWTFMPGGAAYWTAVVISVTLLPVYIELVFGLLRTPANGRWRVHLRQTAGTFINGHVDVGLRLVFLAHQTCLMLDAILRSLIRLTVTGQRLLEWESAAQAEMGTARTLLSIGSYLWLATPLALLTGVAVARVNSRALPIALPFLIAWCVAPLVAVWLNSSLPSRRERVRAEDRLFLREAALRTWQYFAEFSTERDRQLIPDNVHEEGPVAARRISPTNIGLLLNAQLAALDFGYQSRLAFIAKIEAIMASLEQMERYRGHFYNWYDTGTLAAMPPRYVSTVDSGNLAASLIALRQGLLEQLEKPAIDAAAADAVADYCRVILASGSQSAAVERLLATAAPLEGTLEDWRGWLRQASEASAEIERESASDDQRFWAERLSRMLRSYMSDLDRPDKAERIERLAVRLSEMLRDMDFGFLLDHKRKLFHTGYNVDAADLDQFHYALLGSEARTASFIAIAKGDVPQEHWLRLGRTLVQAGGRNVLLSWSGTMFEYLMPMLWLKNYPGTLLDQSARGAVRCQQRYVAARRIPWGISEAACSEIENGSEFRYYAFGIPELALKPGTERRMVIAPYASLLALMTHPKQAADNLRRQAARGWLARYGFYEAADFTEPNEKEALVRSFMAHHQGMSLLALDNALHGDVMRKRFAREPMIEATDLLLQERLPAWVPLEKAPAHLVPLPAAAAESQSAA